MNSRRLKIDSLAPEVRGLWRGLPPPLPIPFLRLRGRWLA